jgi:exodeoxyribonuclease-3
MKIATYNVNGVNGRLPNLLGWLEEAAPDVVCLQELKAPDEKFPAAALRAAGYGAIWQGQKKLEWGGDPRTRDRAVRNPPGPARRP